MTRDMTQKQFDAACARYGFKRTFLGYYAVTPNLHVYKFNAGDRRRDQLAYLIRMAEKELATAAGGTGRRV